MKKRKIPVEPASSIKKKKKIVTAPEAAESSVIDARREQELSCRVTYLTNLSDQLIPLKKKTDEIQKRMNACTGFKDIKTYKTLEHQLEYIKRRMVDIEKKKEEKAYTLRIDQLVTIYENEQKSHQENPNLKPREKKQIYAHMFNLDEVAPEYLNKFHCSYCLVPLLVKKIEAILVCEKCARMSTYLNTNLSDPPQPKQQQQHGNEQKRIKSVTKLLSQFKVGSETIPQNIIDEVKQELFKTHYKSKHLVRTTPVQTILTNLGHRKWTKFGTRIAYVLNGVEISEFNEEQFKEVIERIRAIQHVFIKLEGKLQRINFPAFAFVVNQICGINGWKDLQRCFRLQKTDEVLRNQIAEWKVFVRELKESDPHHKWEFIPPI